MLNSSFIFTRKYKMNMSKFCLYLLVMLVIFVQCQQAHMIQTTTTSRMNTNLTTPHIHPMLNSTRTTIATTTRYNSGINIIATFSNAVFVIPLIFLKKFYWFIFLYIILFYYKSSMFIIMNVVLQDLFDWCTLFILKNKIILIMALRKKIFVNN